MSVSSIQSSIEWIQREIENLHRQQSDEARKEADKSEAISRALEAIGRSSTASMIESRQREIQRLERDRVSIQKKRADITKKISDKTRELHRKQQELFKEQDREQKQTLEGMRRRETQFRLEQDSKLRQLLTPSSAERGPVGQADRIMYDAFISHATEDKDELVRPLASQLTELGFQIWYDEFQLRVGDSLRRSIDKGLANSRFGIVVLSPSFFAKNWPQYELDGLVAKESMGSKVILPLWHKVSKDEVIGYSPTLADKLALNTAIYSVSELAAELAAVLRAGEA